MIKDPAEIEGKEYKEEYLDFMACPQDLLAFQYGASCAREVFFCGGRGRSGECLVGVRGSVCF